jgi:hypothetical protein
MVFIGGAVGKLAVNGNNPLLKTHPERFYVDSVASIDCNFSIVAVLLMVRVFRSCVEVDATGRIRRIKIYSNPGLIGDFDTALESPMPEFRRIGRICYK